ncbi:MAG: HAD family hydrolase [Sphaerochaeta sp.]|nr:HAD family hydrolase [Sphaerochaeta sp.]
MKIEVVCFDIDGTLYPKWVTDLKLVGSFFPSPLLALRYQEFREEIRREGGENTEPENEQGFRLRQASWLSARYNWGRGVEPIDRMYDRIERQFYSSWRRAFAKLTPFPHVRTTMELLKARGIKLAALSDFPIEQKLQALGVADLMDYSACAEQAGYLKPHPAPFLHICRKMGVEPQNVLYVGDSCRKDMVGASRVGMSTCLIAPAAKHTAKRSHLRASCPEADMICSDYLDFQKHLEPLLE